MGFTEAGEVMGVYLRGNIFWVSYTNAKGELVRQSAGTPIKSDAEKLEAQFRAQFGKQTPQVVASVSLQVLLDRCRAVWKAQIPRSARGYGFHADKMLAFFGDVPLTSVTLDRVEAFRETLRTTNKDSSVNVTMTRLAMVLNMAVKWGWLEKNVASGLKSLKVRPSRLRHLSIEEQERLLTYFGPGIYHDLVLVALRTGMRRGELLGLKVRDVDFGRSQLALWQTKNNTPRHIPLIPDAWRALERQCAGKGQEDFVFTYTTGVKAGRPLKNFEFTWHKAVKACNLGNFRFHDLRHTFASDLVMSGAAMTAVSELLGHSTLGMTQRYTHLSPDFRKAEMEKLQDYLRR